MRQNKSTWFYTGGSGLDRTDDFQKYCGSGLDRIQSFWIRIGLGLKNFRVHASLLGTPCCAVNSNIIISNPKLSIPRFQLDDIQKLYVCFKLSRNQPTGLTSITLQWFELEPIVGFHLTSLNKGVKVELIANCLQWEINFTLLYALSVLKAYYNIIGVLNKTRYFSPNNGLS